MMLARTFWKRHSVKHTRGQIWGEMVFSLYIVVNFSAYAIHDSSVTHKDDIIHWDLSYVRNIHLFEVSIYANTSFPLPHKCGVALINTSPKKKSNWGEKGLFHLIDYSPLSRNIKAGTQDRSLKQNPMEWCWLLACSQALIHTHIYSLDLVA